MGVYSKEDIIRIVREEEIEFVRLQFTDIFGMLKNVAITASQIEKAVSNQCMFDGSSIDKGLVPQTAHDLRGRSLIAGFFDLYLQWLHLSISLDFFFFLLAS